MGLNFNGKEKKSKAVQPKSDPAVKPTGDSVVLTPEQIAAKFNPDENMVGTQPRLPALKVLHQSQQFELPDESRVITVTGVILYTSRVNAWWKDELNPKEGGKIPDCFSWNGVVPDSDEKQSPACSTCKLNAYGSDRKGGKGKDCKNMRRIFIFIEDESLPWLFSLSPTSLRSFDDYMVRLRTKKLHYATLNTVFTLTKAPVDGFNYSIIGFKAADSFVDDCEKLTEIHTLRGQMKEQMSREEIVSDEYVPEDGEF